VAYDQRRSPTKNGIRAATAQWVKSPLRWLLESSAIARRFIRCLPPLWTGAPRESGRRGAHELSSQIAAPHARPDEVRAQLLQKTCRKPSIFCKSSRDRLLAP